MLKIDCQTTMHNTILNYSLSMTSESLAIMGPSGIGKTTLLDLIAGIRKPDSGKITFKDQIWFQDSPSIYVPAEKRHVGYVFQDSGLFPHLNVLDNILFGPRCLGMDDQEYSHRLLEMFGLKSLSTKKTYHLSGGEKRRVSIARALAIKPNLLLLDEPMTGLDEVNQSLIIDEIHAIKRDLNTPIILITHSRSIADRSCDRMVYMENGSLTSFD